MNDGNPQLTGPGRNPIGRAIAFLAWVALLAAGFVFSLVAFAVLAAAGAILFGWWWWKTRELRRQIEEGVYPSPGGGRVIEGEIIRDGSGTPSETKDK